MQPFRDIRDALRDKAADNLCADFRAMGIDAQLLRKHPLQKVGTEKSSLWELGAEKKSLGLIQVGGKNIDYVNVIRLTSGQHQDVEYRLEYLVLLAGIPSSLSCETKLKKRTKSRFSRKVVDIAWEGDTLADTLNADLSLKESLLTQCRENSQLKIEIVPESAYGCTRIETRGIQRERWFRGPVIRPPSPSMFDCLNRIAGHVAKTGAL